jgi:hypothetical protein
VELFVAALLFFVFFTFLFDFLVAVLLVLVPVEADGCCPANVTSGVMATAKPIASNVFFIGFLFSLLAGLVCPLTVSSCGQPPEISIACAG